MTETHQPPLHLIILAAGQSSRARRSDSAPPKQFREVAGRMLFLWSVNELCQVPQIASLTVAVPDPWRTVAESALADVGLLCPYHLAPAGETRSGSTFNAAEVLATEIDPASTDLVAVHDAARPFATHHLLNRLCTAAAVTGAAVPGVPVIDTIVRLEEGESEYAAVAYLERTRLKAVQTPQVFQWEPFLAAHRWCHREKQSFTDDGGLLAARGLQPAVVMGEPENWKVTAEGDMARAAAVQARSIGGDV